MITSVLKLRIYILSYLMAYFKATSFFLNHNIIQLKSGKKTIIALLRKTCIINCQLGDLPHLRQTKYKDTSIPFTTFIHHLHWFRGYPPSLKIISGILIYLGHIASGNLRPRLSVTRGKQPIYDTAPQVDPCSQVKYHLPFTFIMLVTDYHTS